MKTIPKAISKLLLLVLIPLAAQLAISSAGAAGGDPPNFDVRQSCRAAGDASGGTDRMQSCLNSENAAREQLVKQWTQFPAKSRGLCLQSSSAGGEPTYTELSTCLEMERDAAQKPAEVTPSPTATGLKSAVERAKGH